MEGPDAFFEGSKLAMQGLFDLLKHDREAGTKAKRAFLPGRGRAMSDLVKLKGRELSKEFLAGSILQIAYIAIERYGVPGHKSIGALHFESEIRRLRIGGPLTRLNKDLVLPETFCVGRDIGHLPLGIIVYAARNQFCHYADDRLTVLNELAFNHLAMIFPDLPDGITFDTRTNKRPISYSVLAALGWLGPDESGFYNAYARDMQHITGVAF